MHIALVVTAAPLAHHTARIVAVLERVGQVTVCPTPAASGWIRDIPDHQMLQDRIRPDCVICAPATFNTANAWAAGLNNAPALGVLNDALGLTCAVLAVPMVAERLTAHPAWPRTLATLTGAGIDLMDITTGQLTDRPPGIASGDGDRVSEHFDPDWLLAWLPDHTR